VLYINGTSKSWRRCAHRLPGVPTDLLGRVINGVRTTVWMANPLMASWCGARSTTAVLLRLIDDKRRIGRERQALARRVLGGAGAMLAPTHANALHLWMTLPDPWTDEGVAAEARRRGVLVTPGTGFAIGRPPTEAGAHRPGLAAQPAEVQRGARPAGPAARRPGRAHAVDRLIHTFS